MIGSVTPSKTLVMKMTSAICSRLSPKNLA